MTQEILLLPSPRGPLSRWCVEALTNAPDIAALSSAVDLVPPDVLSDDDAQLALWMLYEMHYLGFDDVDPAREWDPTLLSFRRELERRFERELRERTSSVVDDALTTPDVAQAIFDLCAQDQSPAVAAYARRTADRREMLELLMHRSVYQLKEADPQTWLIPRLRGRAKAALLQIQYDEYGCGRAEEVHQTLFANTLAACGLDPGYGAYVEDAPGTTLALSNAVSLLGLHRRLRGAAAGYYAAVEATSSMPSRKMSQGLTRLGFGPEATYFFDEHVEADSVHEQLAARELCGSLVQDRPDLHRDVLFGAAAYLLVEGLFATAVLDAWEAGATSLYRSGADGTDAPAVGRVTA
ncbi:MAG TPA: iron-containing redox enzyme family protein [Nocardioidaceae bacterium]|nr:iron-containing redox enzyme family protein [Nocardioidaceae bacterium]